MKVFEIKGPIAAAILARLMANAEEGEDVGCECPKCTTARAMREAAAKADDAQRAFQAAAAEASTLQPDPNRTPCPEFCAWTQSSAYSAMLNETFGDPDSRLERAFIAGMQHEADRAGEAAVNRATSLRFSDRAPR